MHCQTHCESHKRECQTITHTALVPAPWAMCASSSILAHISWLATLISMSCSCTRLGRTDNSVQSSHTASRSTSPPLRTQHPFQTSGSRPCLMFRGSVWVLKRPFPSPFPIYLPTSIRRVRPHRHLRARHPVLSQSMLSSGGRSCPVPSVSPYRPAQSCPRSAVSPLTPPNLPGLASTESGVASTAPLQSPCLNARSHSWLWCPRQGPIQGEP